MYNETFDPSEQVDMEEKIASIIFSYQEEFIEFDNCPDSLNEEDCGELGRLILHTILEKFRPDLIG